MTLMKSDDICAALSRKFCAPEYALFFEVGDATGGRARRWADAVAMGLWPSRGLALQGFEIKVSRSDLLSELRNPAKAESIARYCRYWWLVTPPGLVRDGELPDGWGLYEVHPNGVREVRKAPPNEHIVPVEPTFLAAILRKASDTDRRIERQAIDKAIGRNREAEQKRIDDQVAYQTRDAERRAVEASATVDAIAAACGVSRADVIGLFGSSSFAAAVAMVHKLGVANTYGGLRDIARRIEPLVKMVEAMRPMVDAMTPERAEA